MILAIVETIPPRIVRALERHDMLDDRTDRGELISETNKIIDTYPTMPLKTSPSARS